jgi:hypothetical protein
MITGRVVAFRRRSVEIHAGGAAIERLPSSGESAGSLRMHKNSTMREMV